jgi:hypothetical protein
MQSSIHLGNTSGLVPLNVALSLLGRSIWAKLLSRYHFCLPPLPNPAPDRKGAAMPSLVRLFLALLSFGLFYCHGNALVLQKLQYERAGSSNGCTDSFVSSSLENDSKDIRIAVVDRTTTRSRPRPFIHDQFFGAKIIGYSSIRSNAASRREGLYRSEWESRKSNWRSIRGLEAIKDDDRTSGWKRYSLTDRQVQGVLDLAIYEFEPTEAQLLSLPLPAFIRDVNRHHAASVEWIFGKLPEIVYDVRSRQKMSAYINNESGTVDQLDREHALLVLAATHYWNDGMFNFFNRQDETVLISQLSKDGVDKKKKKQRSQVSASVTGDSHDSGSLVLRNDGTSIGCDVSHPSQSAISIVCPRIDSVGAHKEAPQPTKRDSSTLPPSQE